MKKLLTAALAAAVVLTSCSKENPNDVNGGNGQVTETYALLTIKQSTAPAVSRAGDPSVDAARGEGKINKATIYIFDTNKNLEVIETFDANATSKEVLITTGAHYFLAAINSPSTGMPTGIKKGDHISVVEPKIVSVSAMSSIASNDNFFMTNIDGPKVHNIVAKGGQGAVDNDNKVTIQIGRAMAKVNVSLASNVNQPNGELKNAAAGDVQYLIAGNPNQMYLFPVYDGTQLTSPYFNNTYVHASHAANYFPQISSTDKYTDISSMLSNQGVAVYAMENSNKATPKFGESSYVILTGTYKPNKWFDADNVEEATAPDFGDTFYRIGVLNSTTGKVESFTGNILSEEPTDEQLRALLGLTPLTGDISGHSIVEYENGRTYYGLWLAHNDITDDYVAKHTVARNTFFNVTINEITGPGFNKPDLIPDPEAPIVVSAYIEASISVTEWKVVEQGASIGN